MSQYDFKTPNICTVRGEHKEQRKRGRREREKEGEGGRKCRTLRNRVREMERDRDAEKNKWKNTDSQVTGRMEKRQGQRKRQEDSDSETGRGRRAGRGRGREYRQQGHRRHGQGERCPSERVVPDTKECPGTQVRVGTRLCRLQVAGGADGSKDAGDRLGPGNGVREWLGVGAGRQGVWQAGVEGEGALGYRRAGRQWRSKWGPSD